MTTREDWIGKTGLEWARRADALERLLGPAGQAGLEALAPKAGEAILDLGCGAGASTEALAIATGPAGDVTGVDISPDLLMLAKDRIIGHPNVTLVEADAQTHAFPQQHFDALYSRFGMMFFDDPERAFANVYRALKPGARVAMVAWREPARNLWASVPMSFVAAGMAGQSAGQTGPGPFAWAEPQAFLPVLQETGFKQITYRGHEFSAEISEGDDPDPIARAVAFMTRIGPMAARLKGTAPSARAEAEAFLATRLARHVKDGAVRLLASAWIIEAEV